MQIFKGKKAQISYVTLGSDTGPVTVWTHGWGQSHKAFLSLAESLGGMGQHVLIDFPGFGQSPPPSEAWGTEQYADAMAEFLKDKGPVIWIGHSFGCRVGLQMAAKYPEQLKGCFFIAGAGLKRRRPMHKRIYIRTRIALFKFLKKMIPFGLSEEWLMKQFGSTDYRNAGVMRGVLIKTVNEDLTDIAKTVRCPVTLAYGSDDTETPPETGKRLHQLITNSEYLEFEGLDHYTIIGESRHQVAPHIKKFIEKHTHA